MIPRAYEAATVIVVRETKKQGFEVYLLKRSMGGSFMAGNYVYPGGKVDKRDGDPGNVLFCASAADCSSDRGDLSFRIAGIRELFEEAGILLARDRSGRHIAMDNKRVWLRFQGYRDDLRKKCISMKDLAEKEDLLFSIDTLYPFAHWITPEARPIRFDTHFFIAYLPAGQEATVDQQETTHGVWISPEQALEENFKNAMVLSPPTLKTLEDMSRFASFRELSASLGDKEAAIILPVFIEAGDYNLIVLPWDPEYDDFVSGSVPRPADNGVPSSPKDNTTRIVLKDGRTIPYYRER